MLTALQITFIAAIAARTMKHYRGNTALGVGHITAFTVLTGNTTMGIGHITAFTVLTRNTTMGIGHYESKSTNRVNIPRNHPYY